MSTTKISDLPVLSTADAADEFVVVDDSAGVTKKITQAGLADFGSNTLTAGGITFGADTLDDYEEGTWTPTLKGKGADPTSWTVDFATCEYTKVGRVVFFNAELIFSSISGGSGQFGIGGLPFSAPFGNATNCIVSVTFGGWGANNFPSSGQIQGDVIYFKKFNQSDPRDGVDTNVGVPSGFGIQFSGFYITS